MKASLVLTLTMVFLLGRPFLGKAEVYTALVDMEGLLETERVLAQTLSTLIKAQEETLNKLKRFQADLAREHEKASQDVQTYLSNPINAYTLVKHLTTDWKGIENLLADNKMKEFYSNVTNYHSVLKFPTDEDLNGAAVALMRLQDTYKLDTSAVARGLINGIQYSTALTAGDCFELGRQSYNNKDFYHTVQWMTEALQRFNEEANKTITKADILEYLAFSTYMEGNVHSALEMTDELLTLVPNHSRAIGNRVYYLQDISQKDLQRKRGEDGQLDTSPHAQPLTFSEKKLGDVDELPERELYERLCRGEVKMSPAKEAKLKCRYVHHNNPFLFLARLKEEEAFLSPRILLYHNILADSEIETIKRLAQPRLKRATVQNYKTGELETASYRISKSAWLREEEHPHIAAVVKRVEDLSGLTCDTAEELQVVNYGIGGHYEPHFDFARRGEQNAFKSLGTGNRIATTLFYMSDVPQGGATVFPHLRAALYPTKGTAAFWFNLHRNGEGDYRTRHAACPVLTGSKWVSNKWLHERGQEFKRRCGLTEHED
ncbi:prolyl 4-hydroxylase subunit alpha-1 isoform X3 [Thrips palmi]|nr:prolyl 4-hydroxylase subunit alpha-1 isoform X3 [Thrips palmi]XP_034243817.1 prolyl 4-hydroxylase subunit alpha-1 isoform X3 [Thrips palmi]XP_034243818.1 prolyl 4-hydroxylase subunit alpha-1 isoform X3 [Thrips palmi]